MHWVQTLPAGTALLLDGRPCARPGVCRLELPARGAVTHRFSHPTLGRYLPCEVRAASRAALLARHPPPLVIELVWQDPTRSQPPGPEARARCLRSASR